MIEGFHILCSLFITSVLPFVCCVRVLIFLRVTYVMSNYRGCKSVLHNLNIFRRLSHWFSDSDYFLGVVLCVCRTVIFCTG
jgi:hypothetical protein